MVNNFLLDLAKLIWQNAIFEYVLIGSPVFIFT